MAADRPLSARRRDDGPVLVVYRLQQHPLRASLRDHLYAFDRHLGRPVFHVNLAVRPVPPWWRRLEPSLVVFHTSFLSSRWNAGMFERMVERAAPLRDLPGVRVALPQDEFVRTDLLASFVEEFPVDVVCSVAPESEWDVIYRGVDRARVRFERVLTGYLEPATLARIEGLVPADGAPRRLDLGYRARRHKAWLGRHGVLKGEIADEIDRRATARGLRTDISTDDAALHFEDDWYRFLGDCRWTFGAEGGASVIDRDGTVMARTLAYVAAHPDAPFEEVEAACFPGLDGSLDLRALSPRHLEACATRTAQVLVRGEFNGVLEPGRHFLELEPDLSNLDAVLDVIQHDEATRRRIADAAYEDVVSSGRWTSAAFVAHVARAAGLPEPGTPGAAPPVPPRVRALHRLDRAAERGTWAGVAAFYAALRLRDRHAALRRLSALLLPRAGRAARALRSRARRTPGPPPPR